MTAGWESSLGLTRKGLSKDLGQGCPFLSLSFLILKVSLIRPIIS